jgi:anti-sigma-K factor RskA
LKHERATEEIRERAALYALGCLTQQEARGFETHIQEGCSICQAELHKSERLVAGIGFAAAEVQTPDYIRDLLVARIERENLAKKANATAATSNESRSRQAPSPAARGPVFSQPAPKESSLLPWIIVAAVALVALFAFFSYRSEKDASRQLREKVNVAQSESDNLRILLDVQKDRAGELEQIQSTVNKPGTRILRLAGQPPSPSASGIVFVDLQSGKCLVLGYFPPPPDGKEYQLWFISPLAKTSAGILKLNPAGRVFSTISIPQGVTDFTLIAVTLEPDNGSLIPTLPFYALGRLE